MDRHVDELALVQRGAFARWQFDDLDVFDHVAARRVAAGRWLVPHPGVFTLPSHAGSWRQRLWCASLAVGPGAVVSHESAAELEAMEGMRRGLFTFTVPNGWHHRLPGIVVHQTRDDLTPWLTTIDGLRCTTPARTVVDLAAVLPRVRLAHVAEHAHNNRIVPLVRVGECMAAVSRKGKRGMTKLAAVLDAHGPKRIPPASQLERAFFAALAAAGLPAPQRQFPLPGRQAVTGCVDGAYVDAKVLLEVDGRDWHTRVKQVRLDRERDNEAARAGWLTLRFLWEHVVGDAVETAATVAEVRADRLRLLSSLGA